MPSFSKGDVLYYNPPLDHSSCQPLRGGIAIYTGKKHNNGELYVDWILVPNADYNLDEYRLPEDHWEKVGHIDVL